MMAAACCFQGSVHEGTPRGRMTELFGLPTYVSEPQDRAVRGIIVIIPDAFGIDFVNNKLLADHYADKGAYRVYLPDFMTGHSAPAWLIETLRVIEGDASIFTKLYYIPSVICAVVPWFLKNRIGASYPRVLAFFQALRAGEPDLPVGAAGFCWGGKHIVLLAGEDATVDGKPLLDAGFTGHPSMLSLPGDVEKMKRPVAFALAEKDRMVPVESIAQIKRVVEGKPEGQRGEVRTYANCGHGFCIRADTMFVDVLEQSLLAEDQCIKWFDNHLLKT